MPSDYCHWYLICIPLLCSIWVPTWPLESNSRVKLWNPPGPPVSSWKINHSFATHYHRARSKSVCVCMSVHAYVCVCVFFHICWVFVRFLFIFIISALSKGIFLWIFEYSLKTYIPISTPIMDWMFVSSQKSYVEALSSSVVVFRDGVYNEIIKVKGGHKGGVLNQ